MNDPPIPIVVAGRRALLRELVAASLEANRRTIRILGVFETVEAALVAPSEVVVLALVDGSGIAVVRTEDLATWNGEQPKPVAATILDWDAEPADLVFVVSRTASGTLPVPRVERSPVEVLTCREVEVLGLLGAGWDPSAIAEELGITRNTVRTYLARINDKLGVHSRLAAAAAARDHGIIAVRARI